MNFIFQAIIDFIFPPICPICKDISDERGEICEDCAEKILKPGEYKNPPVPIDKVFRLTKYRGGTRDMLRRIKFTNDLNSLPAFKSISARAAKIEDVQKFLSGTDFAVYVPLNEKRLNERGYNQTELIFEDFLKSEKIPVENILIRTKDTKPLYNLNPEERKSTVSGAFSAVEGIDLTGKKILIADDIFTTGATTSECAKVLKNLGAEKIFVLAFASDFGELENEID